MRRVWQAWMGFALSTCLGGALSAIGQEVPPAPPEKPVDPLPSIQSAKTPERPNVDPTKLDESKKTANTNPDEDPELSNKDPLQSAEIIIGRKGLTKEKEKPVAVPAAPEPPKPPAIVCDNCKSTGMVKGPKAAQAYILFEGDAAPDAEIFLGWTPCDKCKLGLEKKQQLEDEKARIAKRGDSYAEHEKAMHMSFLDFETRHLTGHFQTTQPEARECAKNFEKLAAMLQEHCQSDAFLAAKPATQHLVVCESGVKYAQYLEYFSQTRHDKDNDYNWKELAKTTSSFGSRNLVVIRRDTLVTSSAQGLGHLTVFVMAQMLVHEATDSKAPLWFCEGFSSMCESLIYDNPWCYSIRYEQNRLNFDASWAQAVAKGIRENKAQSWDVIFTREMINMPQLEYQQCWSIVRYLYQLNGTAFAKLPALFQQGMETKKAFEEAYGKPIAQLEAAWRAWAATGR